MEQTLTLLVQIAGTHGTVRLDDFVVPYRPDKASFLVTNNHGFTDMDFAVKTETEERVVRFSCSCQDKIVHQAGVPAQQGPCIIADGCGVWQSPQLSKRPFQHSP